MTGAQASNLYVEPAGPAAEGVVMTSSIAVPGRELPAGPLKDVVDAFADPWLEQNDAYPPQFAFDGATGVQLLVAAIEKAGSTDREKVRDALETLDVLTPTGRFTFSDGRPRRARTRTPSRSSRSRTATSRRRRTRSRRSTSLPE